MQLPCPHPRAFQFSWLWAAEQAQASVSPGAQGPEGVHRKSVAKGPDEVERQVAPRARAQAQPPGLAASRRRGSHRAHSKAGSRSPSVRAGTPGHAARSDDAGNGGEAYALGIAGCRPGLEGFKGRDALAVKAKKSGQELRVSPGAGPHALQRRLPVHGRQNENHKQRHDGIATSVPVPGVGNCAQQSSKLRPPSTACMTPPSTRLQPKNASD
jgi:hypothetical protein